MLEFKNVTFQYEGDGAPMIQNLSFSVAPGDFISLIPERQDAAKALYSAL